MPAKSRLKPNVRVPVKITLPPKVREMGEKLAQEDKRPSLSHEIDWLIVEAFTKRFTKAA